MPIKKHRSILVVILTIVLCASLANVRSVRADGETPTEPPTQVETEPPAEETPVPGKSTPVPTEEEATPIAEILNQLPEGTEVVVLDESGSAIPLATEEAATIAEVIDPMWCPEGVLPGGPGCTINFASISALINNMVNPTHTASYAQNGIIYFTASPGSGNLSLTEANMGATAYNTLHNHVLTLQGGWNGLNDGVGFALSGQSDFGPNPITIGSSLNPWIGNITLNDITFTGASQASLTVYTTTGNITLSNVDVNNQGNGKNTALLNSTSGNITVSDGTYDGNNTNSGGFSATSGGSITITNTLFTENKKSGLANNSNGATLVAPVVTLTNVIATGNDGNGIMINNVNVVTFNNVIAGSNGTEVTPQGFTNNVGSGVFVNGNAGSNVFINGGTFNSNQKYGFEVANAANTTVYIQSAPTCTGNDSNAAPTSSCYNFTPAIDNAAPVITATVSGTAGPNGWYTSDVSVSWSVTDPESGILSSSGCSVANLTSETSGTSLTCSATNNVGLSNSASVTIKIDKTAPTLTLPADITTTATDPSGAVVNYSASATDSLDPSVTVNCSPASGSTFSLGTTTVNCSSTDAAGNTASGSFLVTVTETPVTSTPTPTATLPASTQSASTSTSASSASQSNSSTSIIPVTGGVIDLDCNSVFTMFGMKLSFLNLCNYQTTVHGIGVNSLPGKLPEGFSFVVGLDVAVLSEGQIIQDLPNGTGVQMDFPISGAKDQFAVLYWDGSEWNENPQEISADKISQIISTDPAEEFYQVTDNSQQNFFKTLTTEKAGTFVLVKQ